MEPQWNEGQEKPGSVAETPRDGGSQDLECRSSIYAG